MTKPDPACRRGRVLMSQKITELGASCPQKFLAELLNSFRLKILAAEHLYKRPVFHFIKVQGNRRGFNKLNGGIAKQIAAAEPFYHRLAIPFHFYELAKSDNQLLYFPRPPYVFRIAPAQIQRGKQPPAFEFLVFSF